MIAGGIVWTRLLLVLAIPTAGVLFGSAAPAPSQTTQSDRAIPNDNRVAVVAGKLQDGVLTLSLEARASVWFPEDSTGPAVPVYAFAEPGKPAMVPAHGDLNTGDRPVTR